MNRATIVAGLGVTAFAAALAVYIGSHLSQEAMSVLIGAACGAGAMLPAVIIASLALMRRRERGDVSAAHGPPQAMYPPVIVVAPPASSTPSTNLPYPTMPPSPAPRQFTVIGDDSLDSNVQ